MAAVTTTAESARPVVRRRPRRWGSRNRHDYLFAMMCRQQSVLGSLWFTTGEAQEMADLAGCGALDLSVLEHHVFPLDKINEALNEGLPARHGGFTNFIAAPEHAQS